MPHLRLSDPDDATGALAEVYQRMLSRSRPPLPLRRFHASGSPWLRWALDWIKPAKQNQDTAQRPAVTVLGSRLARASGWLAAGILVIALVAPVTSAAESATPASGAARYERVTPSTDGTGRRYMGREIAYVMGWQGAEWLERSEREAEERTDLLLPQLGLRPGMVVADVGAGTGFIARRMAALVGPQGRVWAVDVQPEMIRALAAQAQHDHLPQIRTVLATVSDVKLAAGSIDLAVMVDVYHELEFPYEVLASVVRALKPGGRVVFVEFRAEDDSVPIKPLHKMSEAQVKREAAVHALVWQRTVELPWQHVMIFGKAAR